ncbi:MAG: ATP-binding protein, partial [Clostridia bacterium]|nr:ATP-binding protein [Clostridia bacterium]
MAKIQLLNENVSSRIAAGEVVERPASVVKELVENSIDAGAKNISVSVTEGGLRSITVSDNGEGMSREDLPLSVLKHATSKIYTLQDLEHINSMGFRGEALSSIAAVSMVEIRTKTPDDELGTILVNKGGRTESIKDAGLSDGTTVTVENLFFNTPAR